MSSLPSANVSFRTIIRLLAYVFAVPGVVIVVLLIAEGFSHRATTTASDAHPKSDAECRVEWRAKSAQGDRIAKNALALSLYREANTAAERAEGLALFTELADMIPADALARQSGAHRDESPGEAAQALAHIYAEGLGVPRDAAQSVRYLTLAEQAQFDMSVPLALAYLRGDGVAKDEAAAIRLLERANRASVRSCLQWK